MITLTLTTQQHNALRNSLWESIETYSTAHLMCERYGNSDGMKFYTDEIELRMEMLETITHQKEPMTYRTPTTRKIAITTLSGGEGKTRTSVDLAHALARDNHRVLLVDLDSQGNDATYLGMDAEPGVFNFLLADQPIANNLRHTERDNLWLLPGNSKNKIIDRIDFTPQAIYDLFVTNLDGMFDYILFDTAPSGLLQESAIKMADILIIPTKTETKGMEAITKTRNAITRLRHDNPPLTLILATLFDKRIKEHKDNYAAIEQHYPNELIGAIPYRAKLIECASYGRTAWEHDPNGDALPIYTKLLELIYEA